MEFFNHRGHKEGTKGTEGKKVGIVEKNKNNSDTNYTNFTKRDFFIFPIRVNPLKSAYYFPPRLCGEERTLFNHRGHREGTKVTEEKLFLNLRN